jgi:hypothetical protein
MRKTHLLFSVLGALGLSACSWDGVDGNGHRVEKERDVDAFTRVRSDCDLDVELTQNDTQSVLVSIDSNLQHLVHTYVEDEVLHVELDADVDDIVKGPHVRVAVPQLAAAKLAGAGSMYLTFDQPQMPLDLYLSGSGDLRFEGRSAALGAYLSGSGEVRLAGEASDVDLELSGSGEIRAKDLLAESGTLDLSGSGEISARVSESVRVSLSGSGEIELYGDPTIDEYRHTGSGDLVRR